MSSSTALARIEPASPDAKAEKIPAVETLTVPSALLLAAESVSAKPGGPQTYLEGVYLHAKGDRGRIVGSDGARLFLASFPLPTKEEGGCPSWMRDGGVILSNVGLKARIGLLAKLQDSNEVRISYAKGNATVEISDPRLQTVSKVSSLHGTYPEYEKMLGSSRFTGLDEEGNVESREWQPVGINSSYLKQCGEIAKMLEKGLEKDQRSKLGMVVRAFGGNAGDTPLMFDFSTWPGAILIVAPAVLASKLTHKETVQLLAPALKATVAALRAHATRWDVKAKEAGTEPERLEAKAKADSFHERVSAVLKLNPGPLLAKAKPEAAPEAAAPPAPEPEQKPEEDPEDAAPARRPATKRTRIHVNGAAA